jgi:hypothetical protein
VQGGDQVWRLALPGVRLATRRAAQAAHRAADPVHLHPRKATRSLSPLRQVRMAFRVGRLVLVGQARRLVLVGRVRRQAEGRRAALWVRRVVDVRADVGLVVAASVAAA